MHDVCRHSEAEKGVMEYAEPMADAVQRLAVPLHNEADLDALLSKVNDCHWILNRYHAYNRCEERCQMSPL